MKQIILQNENLYISIFPEAGGKIHSFYHKQAEFELAAQNELPILPEAPEDDSDFGKYAFGMDDAFPNIDEEVVVWKGRELSYPNHGEIWKQNFCAEQISEQEACFYWKSEKFDYEYEKNFLLKDNRLIIQYSIKNHGGELPCIWTWHGLLRYEEDMQFIYPVGIQNMRNVLDSPELGQCGNIFPLENEKYDFSKVPKRHTRTMVKYYGEECVQEGFCGVVYPSQNMKCSFYYDGQKIPYLGVWITAGGLDGAYNCALEPSTGFYDKISTAKEENRLPVLDKEEEIQFEMMIELDCMSE